jgi:tetratricopeptide (TPR) repeat protein
MSMNLNKIVNQGIAEWRQKRFRKARDLFLKALSNCPDPSQRAILFYNLGLCYYGDSDYDKAVYHFAKSSDLGHTRANWELGLSKLHLENLEGLNLFQWRPDKRIPGFNSPRIPEIKNLRDLEKCQRPLVLNEQGFGDEFLFSRGIYLLEDKDFSYQVYPENLELFRSWWDGHFFADRKLEWDFIDGHDGWIFSGDLFVLYSLERGSSLQIKPSPGQTESQKTGICFRTNELSPNSDLRSIPQEIFLEIMMEKNKNLVSLQKGWALECIESPDLTHFKSTWDVIQGLREIVTIDTSVAHLAALSGKKTYLVYEKYLDWRWKIPFYETDIHVLPLEEFKKINLS